MPSAHPLTDLAIAVGESLDAGAGPAEASAAAEMLARRGVAGQLIAGFFAEGRRKRPRETALIGYAALISCALDTLRVDANGGAAAARKHLRTAREILDTEVGGKPIAPQTLLLLAHALADAQIDPGPAVQGRMAAALERAVDAPQGPKGGADAHEMMVRMAEEAGGDPFTLHAMLAPTAAAFPAEHRLGLVLALTRSEAEAAREAAIGFLLDPDARFADGVAAVLADLGPKQPVASATVERLARLRPWLPPARRAGVDAALKALRPAARPPKAGPKADVLACLATPCDGAGAESLYALVQRGRRRGLVSILIKDGLGVTDAFVLSNLTKRQADELLDRIDAETGTLAVTGDHFERRLAAALAENAAAAPPPFALVGAAEVMGLGPVAPQPTEPLALLDELLAGLPPERTGKDALAAAHRASARWDRRLGVLETWFEAGEALDTLLAPITTRKRRLAAVISEHLPRRRGFWAARCAWTAAAVRSADADDPLWVQMALVGRAIATAAPVGAIPLMKRVAQRSVEAFEAAQAHEAFVGALSSAPHGQASLFE